MIEVRWHGRGGQGGFTVSRLLGIASSIFENKFSLAFPSFGPERRGAPVLAFTRIDNTKIVDRSDVEECDFIVIMDETLVVENIAKGLKPKGVIVLNTQQVERYTDGVLKGLNVIGIDATSLALEILKRPITNTAMFGALVAISGIVSLKAAEKSIEKEMKPALVEKNIKILRRAYEVMEGK